MPVPRELRAVADDIAAGKRRWAKVKTLLRWFGKKGRGKYVVQSIQEALSEVQLWTEPDFHSVDSVHSFLEFKSLAEKGGSQKEESTGAVGGENRESSREESQGQSDDESQKSDQSSSRGLGPALCIGMLPAANRPTEVVTVTRDATVSHAITLMMSHRYSQLPIAQKGRPNGRMISWRSIGRASTKGHTCKYVRDCDEGIRTIDQDAPLLEAVDKIAVDEVVLVVGRDGNIAGMVTTSDLSRKYHELAEPFLLLQEIEDRIRSLIDDNFSIQEIESARRPDDDKREIEGASDLTFGEYVRLLESKNNWKRLQLRIDRKLFVKLLDEVREIRNDVMHFNPDSTENLDKVRMLRGLLEQLAD